jgi:ABC-2 type transport system permease protein
LTKALKVTLLELRRPKFLKQLSYILWICGVVCFLGILNSFGANIILGGKTLKDSPGIFYSYITYGILIASCFSLGQEFEHKTDRIIFTGIFTRTQVIISKLIRILVICLAFFMVYEVFSQGIRMYYDGTYISLTNELGNVAHDLLIFLLYGFMIGSFILFVSAVSFSGRVSGIVTYVCFFDLAQTLFSNALGSHGRELMKSIIRNLPLYIANTGFNIHQYTLRESMVLIISGAILLIATCIIMEKRSL